MWSVSTSGRRAAFGLGLPYYLLLLYLSGSNGRVSRKKSSGGVTDSITIRQKQEDLTTLSNSAGGPSMTKPASNDLYASASWVHRRMGFEPGYVPRYLCSTSSCDGIDLPTITLSLLLGAAFFAIKYGQLIAAVAILVAAFPIGAALLKFSDCERRGRARRRRNECTRCGKKLSDNCACPRVAPTVVSE